MQQITGRAEEGLVDIEGQRSREHLARAGLLVVPRGSVTCPDPDAVAAAGRRAAAGTSVSKILLTDRG